MLPFDVEWTLDLLSEAEIGGNLTSDAKIAALALHFGTCVPIEDADFGRFDGLRWVNPVRD